MAGGQSDGQPDERTQGPEVPAEGQPERLTGGLSGSEWWRVDGPWRVFGTAAAQDGEEADEGVYVAEPAAHRSVTPPARPAAGAEVPVARTASRVHPLLRKRRTAEPPAAPAQPPAAWLIAPASPGPSGPLRPPTAADFPGWDSVHIEFPPDDTEPAEAPAARPVPDQRGPGEEAEAGAAAAEDGTGVEPLPARSLLAGRRPSPLLLLSAGVLVGGAVSGLMLAMLIGWALAYLSRRLGDLTKKFAVFGIPLITMSLSTLWFWGRAQGRWGEPLAKGTVMTKVAFAAAPGVLRLAAVLSALFLLALTLRRRRAVEG